MEETREASGHSEDVERPMAPGPMEVSEDDARILGMEASLELTEISATMDTSNPSKKGTPGWNPPFLVAFCLEVLSDARVRFQRKHLHRDRPHPLTKRELCDISSDFW